MFIIGAQLFIELVERAAHEIGAVNGLEMRDELARFAQRARRVIDKPFVDLGDLDEVLFIRGICFLLRHTARFGCGAGNKRLCAEYYIFFAVIERGIRGIVVSAVITYFFKQTAPTQLQPDLYIAAAVVHTAETRVSGVFVPHLTQLGGRVVLAIKADGHIIGQGLDPRPAQRAVAVDVFGHLLKEPAQVCAYVTVTVRFIGSDCFEFKIREIDIAPVVKIHLANADVFNFEIVYCHLVVVQSLYTLRKYRTHNGSFCV